MKIAKEKADFKKTILEKLVVFDPDNSKKYQDAISKLR